MGMAGTRELRGLGSPGFESHSRTSDARVKPPLRGSLNCEDSGGGSSGRQGQVPMSHCSRCYHSPLP